MENQILLSKIGQTKSQKLIDDCYKIYKENFDKEYPEFFDNTKTKMMSLVTVTEKNEIMGIGMSKLNDLLTDNWGNIFGSIVDCFSQGFAITDEQGLVRGGRVYGLQTACIFTTNFGGVGSLIKVGTGITPPTRQDFELTTVEQTLTSGNGGWQSGLGKIDIPASGTAGSGFIISETGLFGAWANFNTNLVKNFLIAHDLISPTVSVIVGQSINVDYNMLLS